MRKSAAASQPGWEKLTALAEFSSKIFALTEIQSILDSACATARRLTSARFAVAGYDYLNGNFQHRTVSTAEKTCTLPEAFDAGEVRAYLEIMMNRGAMRLSEAEIPAHPGLAGLREGHFLQRGLVGVPLQDGIGRPRGFIAVSDNEGGSFTDEDAILMANISALTFLGLQQVESRQSAELKAEDLDSIFFSLADAVMVADASGKILTANPSAVWLFGTNPVGLRPGELLDLLAISRPNGAPVPPGEFPLMSALNQETSINEHIILKNKKDRSFEVMVSSAPLILRSRNRGAITIWHDVTERENLFSRLQESAGKLEEANRELQTRADELEAKRQALTRARTGLENRVRERTADLNEANKSLQAEIVSRMKTEEDLQVYAQKLEISNRELEDFAFVASHDLQEPLRKIRTFGGMLEESLADSLSEIDRDYLRRMMQAADRMSTLITALLQYSRITTRSNPYVPVDLTETVTQVINDFDLQEKEGAGTVVVESLPVIQADPSQMYQLFQNLIGNAIKFRKDVPPHVRIATIEDGYSDSCKRYWIEVEDNGIGFDPQYADRIFKPFQRLHTRKQVEGTGMGLAICRKIVDRHGGKIEATGAPGEGARFIIHLPEKQSKDCGET